MYLHKKSVPLGRSIWCLYRLPDVAIPVIPLVLTIDTCCYSLGEHTETLKIEVCQIPCFWHTSVAKPARGPSIIV